MKEYQLDSETAFYQLENPIFEKKCLNIFFSIKPYKACILKKGPFKTPNAFCKPKISQKRRRYSLTILKIWFREKSLSAEKPSIFSTVFKTRRDWPKSAPYPKLKNSKRTSKSQFTVLENRKSKKKETLKGGTLWDFPTSILTQNSKKLKGGPFGEKTFSEKKSSQRRKKLKGGPGMVYYTEKQEKPFWFSSLGQ